MGWGGGEGRVPPRSLVPLEVSRGESALAHDNGFENTLSKEILIVNHNFIFVISSNKEMGS